MFLSICEYHLQALSADSTAHPQPEWLDIATAARRPARDDVPLRRGAPGDSPVT